jgi:hypothetical protein
MKLRIKELEFEWPRPRAVIVFLQLAILAGWGLLKYFKVL